MTRKKQLSGYQNRKQTLLKDKNKRYYTSQQMQTNSKYVSKNIIPTNLHS